MEIKEIDRIENKRRFMCEFDLHNDTKLGISFLEAKGLHNDIGVIGNFGPIREKDKNYMWGNFEMNNNEVIRFKSKLQNNKTETLEYLKKLRDISLEFFKQYPQYTCLIYKPLSHDQNVLYDELLNGGWIDQFSLDIQEYKDFKYVYSKAFGSKKEEMTKEDLFRVQRGDYRIYAFDKYIRVKDHELPEFFKELKELEERIGKPIFNDVKWE